MLTDDMKVNLLNVESPLMKQFKTLIPGTYYHSERVSHFLEKIGRELKLDLDFMKIIGMYHDIGKMRYPLGYCENQPKDSNIHDTLPPEVSAHVIISHVANSVAILATAYPDISPEIIRCISRHHGDQLAKSIYNKIEDKTTIDINTYKYPFQKPDDVYSCSLMICDTVEATMKAMTSAGIVTPDNTPDKISDIVQTLIADQQLDTLTIGQHRTIIDVLITEYMSGEQKRISSEYEIPSKLIE